MPQWSFNVQQMTNNSGMLKTVYHVAMKRSREVETLIHHESNRTELSFAVVIWIN